MNETPNYADMIEIPVQTSSVTVVEPTKKRIKKKRKTVEELKDEVIKKVNLETERYEEFKNSAKNNQNESDIDLTEKERALIDKIKNGVELDDIDNSFNGELPLDSEPILEKPEVNTVTIKTRSQKPSIKKKLVAICCIIFVFAVAVTSSVLIADKLSLPTLFSSPEEVIDKYTVFNATIPSKVIDSVTLKDGVMSVSSKGAIYSLADGVVSSIATDGESFTVEITHGEDFKTVFSGMDLTYFSVGEKVYKTLPLGYSNGETAYTVSLYSASGLITDYSLKGDTIVWAEDINGVES